MFIFHIYFDWFTYVIIFCVELMDTMPVSYRKLCLSNYLDVWLYFKLKLIMKCFFYLYQLLVI
jgi:hypothetical protein